MNDKNLNGTSGIEVDYDQMSRDFSQGNISSLGPQDLGFLGTQEAECHHSRYMWKAGMTNTEFAYLKGIYEC